MLFSIIMPTYNAGEVINKSINSVKRQIEKDYELIIIDDGSTDGSTENIKSKLKNINAQFICIKNSGVSTARNCGLKAAKGKYIVFLDADDELLEETLFVYKKVIFEKNEPDVIMAGFYRSYPKKESVFRLKMDKEISEYNNSGEKFNPYMSRFTGCVWGKCYSRNVIGQNEFNTKLSLCEDAEFNFRVFKRAVNFVYVDKLLYRYTYTKTSTIRKYNPCYPQKYIEALEEMLINIEGTSHYNDFLEFACNVFNVICFNVIFTQSNFETTQEKCEAVRQITKNTIFSNLINEVDLGTLPLKHRITIIMAKYERYHAIYGISILNKIINMILY